MYVEIIRLLCVTIATLEPMARLDVLLEATVSRERLDTVRTFELFGFSLFLQSFLARGADYFRATASALHRWRSVLL